MKKYKILFVDDEPNVLRGLTRMLRPRRSELSFHTCESGTEALAWLQSNPCDLVISDMKMPGMDGVEFLRTVRSKYPEVVRLILSGQVDTESITNSIAIVHQYLSKPCSSDELQTCLDRVFSAESRFTHTELKAKLCAASFLPIRAKTFDALREALLTPDQKETILNIVLKSPQLIALLLKITNSPYFGKKIQVHSARRAFEVVGTDLFKEIIEFYREDLIYNGDEEQRLEIFEQYSILTAQTAMRLATLDADNKDDQESIFTTSSLHALGLIFLAEHVPEFFSSKIALDEASVTAKTADETLGANFRQIGSYLLSLWGAPSHVVEAVGVSDTPQEANSKALHLAHTIHLASSLTMEMLNLAQNIWPFLIDYEQLKVSSNFLSISEERINGLKRGGTNV